MRRFLDGKRLMLAIFRENCALPEQAVKVPWFVSVLLRRLVVTPLNPEGGSAAICVGVETELTWVEFY